MNKVNKCHAVRSNILLLWNRETGTIQWGKLAADNKNFSTTTGTVDAITAHTSQDKTTNINITQDEIQEIKDTPEYHAGPQSNTDEIEIVEDTEDMKQEVDGKIAFHFNALNTKLTKLKEHVEAKMEDIYSRMTQVQHDMTFFQLNCKKILESACAEIQDMNTQLHNFQTTINQRLESSGTRVAKTVAHHQVKFQEFITIHQSKFQNKINQDIQNAIQAAIDEQMAPILQEHIHEILCQTQESLTEITTMAGKGTQELRNQTTLTDNTYDLAPTGWPIITMSKQPQDIVQIQCQLHGKCAVRYPTASKQNSILQRETNMDASRYEPSPHKVQQHQHPYSVVNRLLQTRQSSTGT